MRGQILGPDGRPAIGKRRLWLPRDIGPLVLECWADEGATIGTVPRAQGTTPPVLTFGGVLNGGVDPYIQCDAAGALGVWTYKVSYNDGSTFPHTGILSSGSATALPGVGSAITVSAAAGNAATNNIWEALVAAGLDKSGKANHPVEATAANQMIMRAAAFNGRPAFDCGTGATFGLTTPSVSLGEYTVFMLLRGDVNSTWAFVHNVVANGVGSEIFCRSTFNISLVPPAGAGSKSAKNINTTWLSDGVRRTVAVTFKGTHATHLAYRNAALDTTTNAAANDPGTAARTGVMRIGYDAGKANGLRGLLSGIVVANRGVSGAEVTRLHNYAVRRFPL